MNSKHLNSRIKTRTLTVGVVSAALAFGLMGAAPTALADGDDPYPESSASPPVEVDPEAPGLKLGKGAELDKPKVLDLVSVVEDLEGDERREDTNENTKFALQAEVLFGKDSAKLSSQADSRIQEVADEIKSEKAKSVRVFGFTDNLGSEAHGYKLSKQRANAVHKVLDKFLKGQDIKFSIRGYGEEFPVAKNTTEEGRKKNRRVEIAFPRTSSE